MYKYQVLARISFSSQITVPAGNKLTDIFKHHVVADSVMSGMLSNGQFVTTLLGTDVVTINANEVFADNAQVTVADLVADNGVVHVIDVILSSTSTPNVSLNFDPSYLYD